MAHRILMTYKRSTPGTHVYECPNDTYTTSVYVKKSAPDFVGKAAPKEVYFTIEIVDGKPTENDLT